MNWEARIYTYTLPYVKQTASQGNLKAQGAQLVLCDDPCGWDKRVEREVQEGGNTCIHMVDLLHCAAETHTSQGNSNPIKKKKLVKSYHMRTPSIEFQQDFLILYPLFPYFLLSKYTPCLSYTECLILQPHPGSHPLPLLLK